MVIKKNRKKSIIAATRSIVAADTDFVDAEVVDDLDDDPDGLMDAIDDVADNVAELQDAVDDIEEDDVDIMMNNNIADHFIAECEKCHGVFISAVVESNQDIDHVSGVCPLCGKETDQYLKWIIKAANE